MKTVNSIKMIIATMFFLFIATISTGRNTVKDHAAEKILNAFTNEIGGKKAISKIESLTSKSRLEFVESGFNLDREIFETSSNQYFIKVNSPQTGNICRGYDGEKCWEQHAGVTREIIGYEKQSFLNSTAFLRFANWEKTLKEFEYKGVVTREGNELHRIDVITIFGEKESWYFNTTDNMLTQIDEKIELPGGTSTATTTFGDYREVNGVKMSFSQTISMPGQTRKITFSKITANMDIDKNLFSFPGLNKK